MNHTLATAPSAGFTDPLKEISIQVHLTLQDKLHATTKNK